MERYLFASAAVSIDTLKNLYRIFADCAWRCIVFIAAFQRISDSCDTGAVDYSATRCIFTASSDLLPDPSLVNGTGI
ncbi:hypothetical protein [Paenibacillus sp. IHB B 3084]|uniref:hypothetical protein n=1 Tax=Paenibacillus sp. IHB B 3084 TaxID=867076 RepID=UPI001CB8EDAE|nr:hypothetical protein [Paenibacillus sp. IHB B 3084]